MIGGYIVNVLKVLCMRSSEFGIVQTPVDTKCIYTSNNNSSEWQDIQIFLEYAMARAGNEGWVTGRAAPMNGCIIETERI